MPGLKERLIISVSGSAVLVGINLVGILNGPDPLLIFKSLILLITSMAFVGLRKKEFGFLFVKKEEKSLPKYSILF